ncbi:MAG: MFS transporter [Candidatus Thorarchaeota archaeon]|jgi:MFS family permease
MASNADDQMTEVDENESLQSASGFLGLNRSLWRLAIVTGIAQFSISLWSWEFGIFIETFLEPWQMGLLFSISTIASLLGYFLSGAIADLIGRKRTMVFAFIPITIGLLALASYPVWPVIPLEYALVMFGWSFILIMSRAIPADEIERKGSHNAARTFTMILLPAFLVDGISPAVGATLLGAGFVAGDLHLIAACGAVIACLATIVFIRESLGGEIIERAKRGPVISFRRLGSNFWKLAVGMVGFIFFFNAALAYYGNLVVGEWGLSETWFGYAWSGFSISMVLLMHTISGHVDRHLKKALFVAVLANGLVIGVFSLSGGVWTLLLLNFVWAIPVVMWIGAERTLVVQDVDEENKGRALGTYQFITSSTNLLAAPFGALIWTITGSLRTLWALASVGGIMSCLILGGALRSMTTKTKEHQLSDSE